MIDMHNHVLYGVDDGAENLADSLAMIEKAVSLGFDTLVLTPHYMTYRGYTAAPALCDRRMAEIETVLLKDKVHPHGPQGLAHQILLGTTFSSTAASSPRAAVNCRS